MNISHYIMDTIPLMDTIWCLDPPAKKIGRPGLECETLLRTLCRWAFWGRSLKVVPWLTAVEFPMFHIRISYQPCRGDFWGLLLWAEPWYFLHFRSYVPGSHGQVRWIQPLQIRRRYIHDTWIYMGICWWWEISPTMVYLRVRNWMIYPVPLGW
jgi:hypothetical protein